MLWNRKLHYRAHISPRLVPIPSQRHRVTPSHTFLVVHYHIILPSTPSSFKRSFSSLHFLWSITILSSHPLLALSSGPFLHFPTQKTLYVFLFSPVHATHPVYPIHISFDHHERLTTCKCGSPDEDVTDLFSVRMHEKQRPLEQKAALVKSRQRGTTARD